MLSISNYDSLKFCFLAWKLTLICIHTLFSPVAASGAAPVTASDAAPGFPGPNFLTESTQKLLTSISKTLTAKPRTQLEHEVREKKLYTQQHEQRQWEGGA